MSDEKSSPAAGWYPDPENAAGERWWNGVGWSDSRRPKSTPSAAAAGDDDADELEATPAGYVRPNPYAASATAAGASPYPQPQTPYSQPQNPYAPQAGSPSGIAPQPANPYGAPGEGYGAAQPYGAQPYGAQPYGAQQYGAQQYGAQQYGAQPYGAQPYGTPAAASGATSPQPYGQTSPAAYGQPAPYGYAPVQRPAQNIPALVGMILALAGILLNLAVFGLLGLAGGIVGIVGWVKTKELVRQGVHVGNGRGFALTGMIAGFSGAVLTWLFYGVSFASAFNSPY